MAYELALLLAVAVGGWLALQALLARSLRRPALPIGAVGLTGALWAGAELLLQHAAGPGELLAGRRLLYLGAAFLPVSWLWVALEAARPRWYRRRPRLFAAAWIPPAFFCSCLFWAEGGLLVGWTSPTPTHGPLFGVYVAYQWSVAVVALGYFAKACVRLRRTRPFHMGCLAGGALLPVAANALYVAGVVSWDPGPAVLGPAGVLVWLAVVDSGLALHLPLALRDLVDQIDVGVAVADLEGRTVEANRAARRHLGREELAGAPLDELAEIAEGRKDVALEQRRIELRERGAPVGSALLLVDRTDAELAQRRLQLAARLESLGSLTAGIAHEVNNPLAFIRTNLCQLEESAVRLRSDALPAELRAEAEEAAEMVGEIREGIERIRLLVKRLEGFGREEGSASVSLRVCVEEVAARAVARARLAGPGLPIRVRAEARPALVTDENALFQILLNLLINAVQAGGEGGAIDLEIRERDGGLAMQVRDRGPGIPESDRDRIFDPFFTTKPKGSGLGLSLSFDLARQLGGHLEAANAEGGGAVFTLWLPLRPSEASGEAAGPLRGGGEPTAGAAP